MQVLVKEFRSALMMTAILGVIVCGAYPITVFAMAQGLFPDRANGSIVYHNGTAVGSSLLGQQFNGPRYFHPRPSAAGAGYDGTASGGSNLGPTSKGLMEKVRDRVKHYRETNDLTDDTGVPADAATASGSGLDPHISVENALRQAPRVAMARGWAPGGVIAMVRKHTEGRTLGVLGEPRVNLLLLNLALDKTEAGGK